jgi:predicted small lipoprotein YifL
MVARHSGTPHVTPRCFHRPFSRLLPAATLIALTCVLAGCGRKAGLDLPPGAAAQSAPASAQDMGGTGTAARDDVFQQPASSGGGRGAVVAPRGPKKRIPLDVLLD